MSVPFPLLNLPLIPRQKALRLFSSIELFEISLCSKTAAQHVKELRIPSTGHELHFNQGTAMYAVKFGAGRSTIWWDFRPHFPPEPMYVTRKIGDIELTRCFIQNQPVINMSEYYCFLEKPENALIELSNHMKRMFNGTLQIRMVPETVENLRHFFSSLNFDTCETFDIEGSRKLESEQLRNIFQNIKVLKKLVIIPETGTQYPMPQVLNIEHLSLQTATWMKQPDLLMVDCRTIELKDHKFACNDLEKFAQTWLTRRNDKLEMLSIEWSFNESFWITDPKTKRWDSQKRERYYRGKDKDGNQIEIDCANGMDLEREDGALATFCLDLHSTPNIYFLVWKEKFPEKKRLENLPNVLAPFYDRLRSLDKQHPDSSSFERLLANQSLKYQEFVETYRVMRSIDAELHPPSEGRELRRAIFNRMYELIGIDN